MGRSRGTKNDHASQPAPGRGVRPKILDELQEIGGMSPAWHRRNHLVQDTLGEAQELPASEHFSGVPQELLLALGERPLRGAEKLQIIWRIKSDHFSLKDDPLLQALWENDWGFLLERGIVRPEEESKVRSEWEARIRETQLYKQRGGAPAWNPFCPTAFAAVTAFRAGGRDIWESLQSALESADPATASEIIESEIMPIGNYIQHLISEKLEGRPDPSFARFFWDKLEELRFQEQIYRTENGTKLSDVVEEIQSRMQLACDPEEFDQWKEVPLLCQNEGMDRLGRVADPVEIATYYAVHEFLDIKSDSSIRDIRNRVIGDIYFRVLANPKNPLLMSSLILYAPGVDVAMKNFLENQGSNPLRIFGDLFLEKKDDWEELMKQLDKNFSKARGRDIRQLLRDTEWTDDPEQDLLRFVEDNFL